MENASPSSSTENILIEEREEVMVSEKGRCLKKSHFLKPNATFVEFPRRDQCLSVSSSELSSRISFSGFWFAERRFVSWLRKMEALHEPIWRKAGIFEAIKASTYNIPKNSSLILSVSEKWCPETKSFVFPWGEATITLEDVMVLLGFSVLGSPVFAPFESSEIKYSVEKLNKVRLRLMRSTNGLLAQVTWISSFSGRGDQMEHEAFLVLWLSFFVFPARSRRSISRHVIPIAVRLARGERIALAPTVLAFLYSDLTRIRNVSREDKVVLKSLFKLVQVWTWERFKNTRPKARDIQKGEPRIARWSHLLQKTENVRLSFDEFEWRPYTKPLSNWNPLQFYLEEAMWITTDNNLDDEFVSFARCVRSCQIAGDGFVEDYLPNRVAMQFGLAQDLPSSVTHHSNLTEKEAWDNYNKSLNGLMLYMPSRLDRGSVTARYQDWWLKSVSEFSNFVEFQKESPVAYNARNIVHDDYDDVSPKVLYLSEVIQRLEEGIPAKRRRYRMHRLSKKAKVGEFGNSLGWKKKKISDDGMKISEHLTNKRSNDESHVDEDDDNMTISQMIRSRKKYRDAEKNRGEGFESKTRRFKVVDSDDSESCQSKQEKTMPKCDDDVTKEAECWLHGVRKEEDIKERLRQRKLAIKEIELKLEAGMNKVDKSLAMIRKWITRRNQIKI